jgi:hypothetical protein
VSDDLGENLRDLGRRLDVPPTPDVTTAVLNRLDEPPPSPRRRVPRLVTAAIAALLALATAMVVSPAVRAAVFDLLRIGGVDIHQNEPAPTPTAETPLGDRDLSLAEAREAVDFALRLPAGLGEPDTVRVTDDRVVTMSFGEVRVDQFDGGLDPIFEKFAMADDIHRISVGDRPGIWVDRPHVVVYTDEDGVTREEGARLAASTLIWEDDGVTYRVEGDLTQPEALAIAESMN